MVVVVYFTASSLEEAKKISRALLEKRLVACANSFKGNSLYNWSGELVDEDEFIVLCKTTEERAGEAEKLILSMHSYDLPSVIRFPVKANKAYSEWVERETRPFKHGPATKQKP